MSILFCIISQPRNDKLTQPRYRMTYGCIIPLRRLYFTVLVKVNEGVFVYACIVTSYECFIKKNLVHSRAPLLTSALVKC
jgi:hypothetical protein